MMFFATKRLRDAVRAHVATGERQYALARRAGFRHPSALSLIITGAVNARSSDNRVTRLLEIIGLTFDEAFTSGANVDEPRA